MSTVCWEASIQYIKGSFQERFQKDQGSIPSTPFSHLISFVEPVRSNFAQIKGYPEVNMT